MTTVTPADRYLFASRMLRLLNRPEEAMSVLDEGIQAYPGDPTLLRFRGHGHITAGNYPAAVADLERAAEAIQGTPDEHEFYSAEFIPELVALVLDRQGDMRDPHLPVTDATNEATKGLYKSTLHGSVWYHLAVAQYLLGDFEAAATNFQKAGEVSLDDDLRGAVLDWSYMILRRLGKHEEAKELIADLDTSGLESSSSDVFYFRRLKMYKGEISPEELLAMDCESDLGPTTQGYGVGNWYLYHGDEARAREVFAEVVERGNPKAFAYMAAKADLARL